MKLFEIPIGPLWPEEWRVVMCILLNLRRLGISKVCCEILNSTRRDLRFQLALLHLRLIKHALLGRTFHQLECLLVICQDAVWAKRDNLSLVKCIRRNVHLERQELKVIAIEFMITHWDRCPRWHQIAFSRVNPPSSTLSPNVFRNAELKLAKNLLLVP